MIWNNEKEKLEKMILQDKLSYEEIGRQYNCTGANIKKVAKKLGIFLEQRREINPKEHFNKKTSIIEKTININNDERTEKIDISCYNPKKIGNIGEVKTLAKFVEYGIPVYLPFGDNEKADLIADFNGKLNKIQVKTSIEFKNNSFIVSLISSTRGKAKNYKHKYNLSEIDYFCVYNIQSSIILLIPINDVIGRTQIQINIPYKNSQNQYKNLNYKDYLFENIIHK